MAMLNLKKSNPRCRIGNIGSKQGANKKKTPGEIAGSLDFNVVETRGFEPLTS